MTDLCPCGEDTPEGCAARPERQCPGGETAATQFPLTLRWYRDYLQQTPWLQQAWTDENGETVWRDVPQVIGDAMIRPKP